jgi:hypothetical protein
LGVSCELRLADTTLDFVGVALTRISDLPITLLSTAALAETSDGIAIVCQTDRDGAVATAIAVQLVGVSVDQVFGPMPGS